MSRTYRKPPTKVRNKGCGLWCWYCNREFLQGKHVRGHAQSTRDKKLTTATIADKQYAELLPLYTLLDEQEIYK